MATYQWDVLSGDWSDSANWVTYVYDPVSGQDVPVNGAPEIGDTATVGLGTSAFVDTSTAAAPAAIDVDSGTLTLGLDLLYAGAFTMQFAGWQLSVLDLDDHKLTLAGFSNNLFGELWGPGTLLITGSANVSAFNDGLMQSVFSLASRRREPPGRSPEVSSRR